jgi:hypothetical protein
MQLEWVKRILASQLNDPLAFFSPWRNTPSNTFFQSFSFPDPQPAIA